MRNASSRDSLMLCICCWVESGFSDEFISVESADLLSTYGFMLAVILFFLRDAALYLILTLTQKARRGDLAFLIYLGLLYLAVPSALPLLQLDHGPAPIRDRGAAGTDT